MSTRFSVAENVTHPTDALGSGRDADAAATRGRRRVQWGRARRALRTLLADSSRTDQVFELITAIEGSSADRLYQRFLAHPDGPPLLARRPALLPTLSDRAALAAMPEESLGRAYLAFMSTEQLTADGLVEASLAPSEAKQEYVDPERRWFFDRMRDMHDLWHVLTGYGRDEAGESANLAFTYGQTCNRGTGLIVLTAAVIGAKSHPVAWPRYLFHAWRRGRRAAMLSVAPWEELLPQPLALVRQSLHIELPERAHPEGLVVGNRGDA